MKNGTVGFDGRVWKTDEGKGHWISCEAYENNIRVIREANKKHVYLDGKYLGLEHNLGIPAGRYKTGDHATVVFPVSRAGFVYVITNEAWPELCKIGRSHDPEKRIQSANTWCPYSKFKLADKVFTQDSFELEQAVHKALEERGRDLVGEWFEINQYHAFNLILKVQRELLCKRLSSTSKPMASTTPSPQSIAS